MSWLAITPPWNRATAISVEKNKTAFTDFLRGQDPPGEPLTPPLHCGSQTGNLHQIDADSDYPMLNLPHLGTPGSMV